MAGMEKGPVSCIISIVYYTLHIHTGTQALHIFRTVTGRELNADRNTLFHLYEVPCRIILR